MRGTPRHLALLTALCGLLTLTGGAWAANSTHSHGYSIHYNALITDMLNPQVATAYKIRRSGNRALVNITIFRDQAGTTGEPVAARVKLTAHNLLGQSWDIPLRKLDDGGAIYYLADFPVHDQEHLMFDIEAQVPGDPYKLKAHFDHTFFTE